MCECEVRGEVGCGRDKDETWLIPRPTDRKKWTGWGIKRRIRGGVERKRKWSTVGVRMELGRGNWDWAVQVGGGLRVVRSIFGGKTCDKEPGASSFKSGAGASAGVLGSLAWSATPCLELLKTA